MWGRYIQTCTWPRQIGVLRKKKQVPSSFKKSKSLHFDEFKWKWNSKQIIFSFFFGSSRSKHLLQHFHPGHRLAQVESLRVTEGSGIQKKFSNHPITRNQQIPCSGLSWSLYTSNYFKCTPSHPLNADMCDSLQLLKLIDLICSDSVAQVIAFLIWIKATVAWRLAPRL